MNKAQEDRLIQSCKLLVDKLKKQPYSRMNGSLPPAIRKQLNSIIKQASKDWVDWNNNRIKLSQKAKSLDSVKKLCRYQGYNE